MAEYYFYFEQCHHFHSPFGGAIFLCSFELTIEIGIFDHETKESLSISLNRNAQSKPGTNLIYFIF